jgi:hypothetical protein
MKLMADEGVDKPIVNALRKQVLMWFIFWKQIKGLVTIIF